MDTTVAYLANMEAIAHSVPWYGVLLLGLIAYKLIHTFQLRKVLKQLGCHPPITHTDHMFGFKQVKMMTKAKNEGRILQYVPGLFDTIGDTAQIKLAGSDVIITREPENIKAMLGTQFNDFGLGLRHPNLFPLLGDGIFTLDNQGWKHSRAMLRPQFAREQVAHVKTLEPHVQRVMAHVRRTNGKVFDIQEIFFRMTLDSATEFLFGESVDSLYEDSLDFDELKSTVDFKLKQDFARCFNDAQETLATRSFYQKLYFLIGGEQFKSNCRTVHELTDIFVGKALSFSPEQLHQKLNGGYTFLYELVKQTRDPKILRDQALNILLAGRDTTAGLLSFVFLELARNPVILEMLKQEVYATFGAGKDARVEDITFESLKKCEYLKAVINETLRLYPSVPRNLRTANKHTSLPRGGGKDGMSPIFVSKNSLVFYFISATHRNSAHYGKDVLQFRPERWFEHESRKLGWAYLPFNGGPRICLGQQFALTEASYVIVRLVQEFPHLQSGDAEYPPRTNAQLTMGLMDGCRVSMY